MKIQYQIFQILDKKVLEQEDWEYLKKRLNTIDFSVSELYFGLNSFDSIEEAVQHLSTLEKGKYTILTVYEN